jgi:hypothetical protein
MFTISIFFYTSHMELFPFYTHGLYVESDQESAVFHSLRAQAISAGKQPNCISLRLNLRKSSSRNFKMSVTIDVIGSGNIGSNRRDKERSSSSSSRKRGKCNGKQAIAKQREKEEKR